jgi:hypothetical protein
MGKGSDPLSENLNYGMAYHAEKMMGTGSA